ncbi:MAG: PHP domain-containing protein [Spirochaetota bacterium]
MLKVFNCDLHIHTCLSPCADLDMHPSALVERALDAKLDLIAICDHNSSENVQYVIKAALNKNIKILPGMEVTTSEEVHVLAIFDNLPDLLKLQEIIYAHLPGENNEKRFGVQAIVNENAEVEGLSDRLLIGATDLSLDTVISHIHQHNGLAIASHIDHENFSVLSQLGFISEDMHFDALEISAAMGIKEARKKYKELNKYSFITSSDAHYLKDIGTSIIKCNFEKPSFSELKMAFSNENGRCVLEQ